MPIYWTSFWLIIINTAVGLTTVIFLQDGECELNSFYNLKFTLFLLISLPLIWKLWRYHVYKIKKFIKKNCDFKVYLENGGDFWHWPSIFETFSCLSRITCVFFVVMICLVLLEFFLTPELYPTKELICRTLRAGLVMSIVAYFWIVPVGLGLHIVKLFSGFHLPDVCSWFSPEFKEVDGNYTTDCSAFWQIMVTLFKIV